MAKTIINQYSINMATAEKKKKKGLCVPEMKKL